MGKNRGAFEARESRAAYGENPQKGAGAEATEADVTADGIAYKSQTNGAQSIQFRYKTRARLNERNTRCLRDTLTHCIEAAADRAGLTYRAARYLVVSPAGSATRRAMIRLWERRLVGYLGRQPSPRD